MIRALLMIAAVLAGSVAEGQSIERVLLPVVTTSPVTGAFGSVWESRVAVTNTAPIPVNITGFIAFPLGCGIAQCSNRPIDPGITFFPVFGPLTNSSPARFLSIEAAEASKVRINLRSQDLSRQLMTWGTAVPIVRPRDFFDRRFSLLDVPHDDRFRWTLRIYEPTGLADTQVRVRFYATRTSIRSPLDPILDPLDPQPIAPDRVLLEQTVTVYSQTASAEHRHGYAEVAGLTVPMALGENERLRIEIEPLSQQSLWAFVAITNNETQHITTVQPL